MLHDSKVKDMYSPPNFSILKRAVHDDVNFSSTTLTSTPEGSRECSQGEYPISRLKSHERSQFYPEQHHSSPMHMGRKDRSCTLDESDILLRNISAVQFDDEQIMLIESKLVSFFKS